LVECNSKSELVFGVILVIATPTDCAKI
jgi:hypothetical protein